MKWSSENEFEMIEKLIKDAEPPFTELIFQEKLKNKRKFENSE